MSKAVIGICKYCGEEKRLCGAHIIPECFFIKDKEDKAPYLSLSEKEFVKRFPQGMYDRAILCAECDNKFSVYESHAKELFNHANFEKYRVENTDRMLFSVPADCFDYKLLRMFFLSLIWRASISNEGAFEYINLGKYEDIALSILKDAEMDNDKLFGIFVFRYENSAFEGLVTAVQKRLLGDKGFLIAFAGFLFFIIPNPRNVLMNPQLSSFLLSKDKLDVLKADENFAGLLKMARNTYKRQQNFIQERKNN